MRDPRNSKCDYDCEVRKVRSPETLLCLDFYFLAPPPSLVIGSSIISTNGTGSRASSGCRLGIHLLRHLFGTVVRQTQAHDGQHHGYLVDSTVLWLRLHLTCYLPLQRRGKGSESSGQKKTSYFKKKKPNICNFSSTALCHVTQCSETAIKNLQD